MIIDSHAHVARVMTGFWEPLRYGKALDRGEIRQLLPASFDPTASPPEILLGYMDQAGVDRTILVQHHMYGNQNETVLECLKTWPDRFAGYAYLGKLDNPDDPDVLERLIERGMLGLKIEIPSTRRLRPSFAFDGDHEMRIFERLNALGRPLALDVNGSPESDTVALRKVVAAFPNLPLVICHVGGTHTPGWEDRARLANKPNGWVDLAALPLFAGSDEEYPYPRAQKWVRWAAENLGVERLLWGTDYPPTIRTNTYGQLQTYISRHCDFLSAEDKAAVLGGNATRLLELVGS